jgi:formate hydrogenlyase subunit 6/NADH:ubiquinone oxidoreductase subunit I
MPETQFAGLCVRCGNCARVCPARIIGPSLGEHGVASLLTPTLDYEDNYCLATCSRCTEVCPSGALRRLGVEEKPRAAIGLPQVQTSVCLLSEDRECAACRNACPYEAIAYVFNESDYTLAVRIDASKCNGCGACQAYCPTTPRKAIVVRPIR